MDLQVSPDIDQQSGEPSFLDRGEMARPAGHWNSDHLGGNGDDELLTRHRHANFPQSAFYVSRNEAQILNVSYLRKA